MNLRNPIYDIHKGKYFGQKFSPKPTGNPHYFSLFLSRIKHNLLNIWHSVTKFNLNIAWDLIWFYLPFHKFCGCLISYFCVRRHRHYFANLFLGQTWFWTRTFLKLGPIKLLLSVCLSATHFSQNWLISWTPAKPKCPMVLYPSVCQYHYLKIA